MSRWEMFDFACQAVLKNPALTSDLRHSILWVVTYSGFSLN
jgi:hypothetical protein